MRLPCFTGRWAPVVAGFGVLLLTQTLTASPAGAQGFFQQLFGAMFGAAPRPSAPPQAARLPPRASVAPARQQAKPRRQTQKARSTPAATDNAAYTTVCVRMCDGFYFPIGFRVPRGRFGADANVCRARCGEAEARLFYYSSTGGDMESAVDLAGRSYTDLPVAFKHRTTLVAGCGCRPEPWSEASLARHDSYAIAAGRPVPLRQRDIPASTVAAAGGAPVASRPPQPLRTRLAAAPQPTIGDVPATAPVKDPDGNTLQADAPVPLAVDATAATPAPAGETAAAPAITPPQVAEVEPVPSPPTGASPPKAKRKAKASRRVAAGPPPRLVAAEPRNRGARIAGVEPPRRTMDWTRAVFQP